jgi:hypothetical protein
MKEVVEPQCRAKVVGHSVATGTAACVAVVATRIVIILSYLVRYNKSYYIV